MKSRILKFLAAPLLLLLLSCQKDDICPPGIETTPRLVIEFFDHEDPTTLKAVQNLYVFATGEEDTLLGPQTTNSISIPLRTDQGFTQYHFVIVQEEDTIEDVLTFYYNPATEYLNRACGYKINFLDLKVDQQEVEGEENWIRSYTILQENVENEATPHISFTH